jgi:putative ubiquitin-RnfH superfamily antitoxin RatB of RatAB toxin-antitoxin module
MAEIVVEVCYAKPDSVFRKSLRVPAGTEVRAAIEQSGVLQVAPEIDLPTWRVGVYGKLKTLDAVLREHDRIEIYRPLIADPKEARRRRAAHREKAG